MWVILSPQFCVAYPPLKVWFLLLFIFPCTSQLMVFSLQVALFPIQVDFYGILTMWVIPSPQFCVAYPPYPWCHPPIPFCMCLLKLYTCMPYVRPVKVGAFVGFELVSPFLVCFSFFFFFFSSPVYLCTLLTYQFTWYVFPPLFYFFIFCCIYVTNGMGWPGGAKTYVSIDIRYVIAISLTWFFFFFFLFFCFFFFFWL